MSPRSHVIGASTTGFATKRRRPFSPLDRVKIVPFAGAPGVSRQITVVEFSDESLFTTQRLYWLHNLRVGEIRGGHAHRRLEQLFCPIAGAFEVELDDGLSKVTHRLDDATSALYVPEGLWRTIRVDKPSSVLLVLASLHFEEADYIWDYREFRAFASERRTLAARLQGSRTQELSQTTEKPVQVPSEERRVEARRRTENVRT